jgi:large subunit ribosomal protein L10
VVINQGVEKEKFGGSAPAAVEASVAEAHAEEANAGEQPSGAAQPENATASQAGEAATSEPVEG